MNKQLSVLLFCLVLIAAAAFAHGDMQHIMGTVTQVSADSITVKTTKGDVLTIGVAANTQFMRGKVAAKISDLKAGDKVVIHAKKDEKDATKLVAHMVMIGKMDSKPHDNS